MDIVVLVGRVLLVLIALGSGTAGHFGATTATAAYAESRGVKNPRMWVRVSGVWLISADVCGLRSRGGLRHSSLLD